MTFILRAYIEPTTPIMSKKAMYVLILGNHYLLDALGIHIYKNVLYWKFLLITKRVILFQCIDPLVKLQMNLTPLFDNLEKLTTDIYSRKADFVLMIGDIDAKSCNRSTNDTTTPEGAQLDYITSFYGMKQLISEPSHILHQSSGCMEIIFTSQANIVRDSVEDSSLHSKCHHQIIYSKPN